MDGEWEREWESEIGKWGWEVVTPSSDTITQTNKTPEKRHGMARHDTAWHRKAPQGIVLYTSVRYGAMELVRA